MAEFFSLSLLSGTARRRMRQWLRGVAMAAVAAAALGRVALAQAAPPESIRIGVATAGGGDPVTWGGSPGGVVRNQRWLEDAFRDAGVKVEWLFFKGAGPAVNEALSNRQIDFAYQGDLPSLVGRANGLGTRLLLASGTRNNLYLVTPPGSDIASVKDLKGRKTSIFRGTNGHIVVVNLLAANGLAERDLKGVNLDAGSAQAALVSSGVDAAFGGYEWFKVRDQGLARIVYSTQGKDPAFTRQAGLVVRSEFEQAHPQEVQRVVDVFVRAARWASDEHNRDALFAEWARSGTPVASWQAEFEGQSLAERNSPLLDEFVVGRYKAVVEDAFKLRLLRKQVTVDDWVEPKYLRAALKSQGLEAFWTPYDKAGKPKAASVAAAGAAAR